MSYVVRVEFLQPLPDPFPHNVFWAKCDMVATVGLARLDRVKSKIQGIREYRAYHLGDVEMAAILAGVRAALGLA